MAIRVLVLFSVAVKCSTDRDDISTAKNGLRSTTIHMHGRNRWFATINPKQLGPWEVSDCTLYPTVLGAQQLFKPGSTFPMNNPCVRFCYRRNNNGTDERIQRKAIATQPRAIDSDDLFCLELDALFGPSPSPTSSKYLRQRVVPRLVRNIVGRERFVHMSDRQHLQRQNEQVANTVEQGILSHHRNDRPVCKAHNKNVHKVVTGAMRLQCLGVLLSASYCTRGASCSATQTTDGRCTHFSRKTVYKV